MARIALIVSLLTALLALFGFFQWAWAEWKAHRVRKKMTWVGIALFVCLPWSAEAACTGASPTWTCGVTRTEIVDLVNNNTPPGFVSGDTVNVSAGSATWSSINFASPKTVKLIGAGIGNTIITLSGVFLFCNDAILGARVSGFTFHLIATYLQPTHCRGYRIDHNAFDNTSYGDAIQAVGGRTIADQGLIDHNTFLDTRVTILGQGTGSSGAGDTRWSEALNLGMVSATYIEDNEFTNTTAPGAKHNSIDGNRGSETVARFNTFHSGRFEQHSLQAEQTRAVKKWEFYGNRLDNSLGANYSPFLIRGGTGVIFHNQTDGGFSNTQTVEWSNIRSSEMADPGLGFPNYGFCDGITHPIVADQNTSGFNGWRCRDQIGASTDASFWDYTNPAPLQASVPAYIWRNIRTDTGNDIGYSFRCTDCTNFLTYHVLADRDFYADAPSFNGTSGVGEGLLVNRPASCTTGVAYWATDQGSWNTSSSNPYGVNAAGEDGRLYVCGASNNWVLAYTPYTYPHPLNVPEDGDAPLAASPVVIARVLRWMEVAAFVTGMGWHLRKPIMAVSLAFLSWTMMIGQLTPRVYDTMKSVSRDSAVKVLTVVNHLTKPRS